MNLLIKNTKIVNFDSVEEGDILIANSRIVKIGKIKNQAPDKVIDGEGKFVLPGLIDIHTHLRTPGREDEEDLLSGSRAAVKGGFTTIFCMPNTHPPIDNEGVASWITEEATKIGIVDIYPVGAITKNREGKELTEFWALKRAGCLSLSDDGQPVRDSSLLRRALEYARMADLLIISHCEDKDLSLGGVIREGVISSKYGLRGVPYISESNIVFRDIELAKYLNTKIHLTHISTRRSIEIIKRAKEEGVRVSCDTAPHYFILSVKDIEKSGFDSNLKVNPPLPDEEDKQALKQALKEGVIDCIATDHAPHSKGEKELPFEEAPSGFIGLELAFSLTYTYLVKDGILDLKDLVKKMAYNPACILGLKDRGYIKEGNWADLTIVDLSKRWEVEEEKIVSKSKNTPFIGYTLDGVVTHTIYRGKIVYSNV